MHNIFFFCILYNNIFLLKHFVQLIPFFVLVQQAKIYWVRLQKNKRQSIIAIPIFFLKFD